MRTTLITLLLAGVAATFVCGSVAAAIPEVCKNADRVTPPSPEEGIALVTYLVARGDAALRAAVRCEVLSGSNRTGYAVLEGLRADARRAALYANLSKDWTPRRRAAFVRLLAAEDVFAKAVGENETDQMSAESAADAIIAQQAEKNAFLNTLRTVVSGTARLSFVEFAESDSALNAAYRQVMAVPDPSNLAWGSVEKAGIQRTQRIWVAYRDAFVAFAATLSPDAADAVKAELTTRRTVSLEGFLED